MRGIQKRCRQCGRCCQAGGPALHLADLGLVRSGRITWGQLVTLRRGEPAHNPVSGRVQPVAVELVKLAGKGGSWQCSFLSPAGTCQIYSCRPEACRQLKCWDTREILALVEQDTLDRQAILASDSPLLPLIAEHQMLCPCDELAVLLDGTQAAGEAQRQRFARQAQADLDFRTRVIAETGLSLAEELFVFGRPFFQLLQQLGVGVATSPAGIVLHWPLPPNRS
jgi:Fe-S-cluster containining protein